MKRNVMVRVLCAIGFLALAASGAQATVITVQSGGITINAFDTTTLGTAGATAWTIDETMTAAGTLKFLQEGGGSPVGPANPTGSGHTTGKWINKTITNNTGVTWTSFELELQVLLGTASGQGDGLSFADGSILTTQFVSDQFSVYTRQDVLRDYLNFSGGDVLPGQSVTFSFAITDNSGNNPFYLLQTPNKSEAQVPEPVTLALLGLGLAGLGWSRRKKA